MLANRHLWRFSAESGKEIVVERHRSLVFRPEAGRVTGKDLQNYFCSEYNTA